MFATVPHSRILSRLGLGLAGFVVLCWAMLAPKPASAQEEKMAQPRENTDRPIENTLKSWLGEFKRPSDSEDRISLPLEQYQALREQLRQLEAKQETKPLIPSRCLLHAQVQTGGEGTPTVRIRATFEDEARQADQIVVLNCRNAKPIAATLMMEKDGGGYDEGRLPMLLPPTDEGFSAVIDRPGRFRLVLELEVPVASRGASGTDVGYELHLPGCPITLLAQDPIPKVSSIRLTTREVSLGEDDSGAAVPQSNVEQLNPNRLKPRADSLGKSLGPIGHFSVSWELPASAAPSTPLRSAQAEVEVRVTDTEVVTEAKLRLNGAAREWTLWAPADAEVTVEPASRSGTTPEDTVDLPFSQPPTIRRPSDPKRPFSWTIRFEESPPAEFVVRVQTSVLRDVQDQKSSEPVSVGPFAIADLFPQQCTIRVISPPHLRMVPRHPNEVRRVEDNSTAGPLKELRETVFRYGAVPLNKDKQPVPPLTFEVVPVAGRLFTNTRHQLDLAEGGWHLRTEVTVTPIRMKVDQFEMGLPPGLENLEAHSTERGLVEGLDNIQPHGSLQRVQVRLAREANAPFRVQLEGFFPLPLTTREATFSLPRVIDTVEGKGEVIVRLPEGMMVRGAVREWEHGREGPWPYPLERRDRLIGPLKTAEQVEFMAKTQKAPTRISMTWEAAQPDLLVESEVDLLLTDRQGVLSHRLRFQPNTPRQIRLRGSETLSGVRLTSEGTLNSIAPGEWIVTLPPTLKSADVDLTYAFSLPDLDNDTARITVPLVWVDDASHGDTRVRIWRGTKAGLPSLTRASADHWQEQPTEVVPRRDALPALVLVGSGTRLPLTLKLAPSPHELLPQLWVDRALIQMITSEGGGQQYRARYRIRKWLAGAIDMDLPAPPMLRNPEFYLDGKRITDWEILTGPSAVQAAEPGWQTVRIPIRVRPSGQPMVLEVRYQLGGGDESGPWDRWTRWEMVCTPPKIQGSAFMGPARWQVNLPDGRIPLYFGGGLAFDQQLTWDHGLFRFQAARSTAELEQWFSAGIDQPSSENLPVVPVPWNASMGELTGRQGNLDQFHIIVVSRWGWLFGCSLVTLLVGLLLWRLPSWLFWMTIVVLGLGVGTLTVGWPQLAGQLLAGAQLGLLTLGGVLLLRWLFQRRYRRRVTYMSGFSRRPEESSLVAELANRDGTTVDAPAPMDVWASPEPQASSGSNV